MLKTEENNLSKDNKTTSEKPFVHLRVHSSYSLSESAIKPEEISELCIKNEIPAIAVTDSGNLFGLLEISLSCAKKGVQLIPAVEANLSYDREKKITSAGKVVLIAKDFEGYQNLLKLVSNGYFNSDDHTFPIITIDELEAASNGIICLTGGHNGFIDQKLKPLR